MQPAGGTRRGEIRRDRDICWGENFGYDIWGNLLSRAAGQSGAGCTYEPLTVGVGAKNQILGFCYDAAGNLTRQATCGSADYTYDAENRITSTAGVTYTYDGDGERVKKSSGTLYWGLASNEPLAESDLAGTLNKERSEERRVGKECRL